MSKVVDLTGQRFGKLVVVERAGSNKSGNAKWLCKCDCGNEVDVVGCDLRRRQKSCGCLIKHNTYDTSDAEFVIVIDVNGNKCLIDSEDLEKVKQHTWLQNKGGYFHTSINGKTTGLHRFLLNPSSDEQIDHINNNPADNRKQNLRFCTQQQNTWNVCKRKGGSSKYKGVTWNMKRKQWYCSIKENKKNKFLGVFNSEEEAGKRYDEEAKKLFGEFAKLNFVESDGD